MKDKRFRKCGHEQLPRDSLSDLRLENGVLKLGNITQRDIPEAQTKKDFSKVFSEVKE